MGGFRLLAYKCSFGNSRELMFLPVSEDSRAPPEILQFPPFKPSISIPLFWRSFLPMVLCFFADSSTAGRASFFSAAPLWSSPSLRLLPGQLLRPLGGKSSNIPPRGRRPTLKPALFVFPRPAIFLRKVPSGNPPALTDPGRANFLNRRFLWWLPFFDPPARFCCPTPLQPSVRVPFS